MLEHFALPLGAGDASGRVRARSRPPIDNIFILFYFILFYFILTLIWLVSHAELLDTCLFSQKTFEGIKTET